MLLVAAAEVAAEASFADEPLPDGETGTVAEPAVFVVAADEPVLTAEGPELVGDTGTGTYTADDEPLTTAYEVEYSTGTAVVVGFDAAIVENVGSAALDEVEYPAGSSALVLDPTAGVEAGWLAESVPPGVMLAALVLGASLTSVAEGEGNGAGETGSAEFAVDEDVAVTAAEGDAEVCDTGSSVVAGGTATAGVVVGETSSGV